MDVPMLDEVEWTRVTNLWRDGKHKLVRSSSHGSARTDPIMTEANQAMLDEYARITRYVETNPSALWHHRLSLYGPPCEACGKPLRTPTAAFCAACGHLRNPEA
jgi:hypothetical protein